MEILVSTFVLLVAVALSSILARFIPMLATTYINILIGVIMALVPQINHLILPFNNEIFMVLFLAPLLFFEGQKTPIYFVKKRLGSIFGMAVVLAVITVVIGAVILHVTFGLGLSLALIIVAIATPTDATALGAVIVGRHLPQTIHKSLNFESLFNDATGIVLLQAGIIGLTTGHLTYWQNGWALLVSAGDGVIVGVVIAMLIMVFRQSLLRTDANVVSAQNLIYLLTPFIIYVIAEKLAVSGIIAVVVAGLVSNSEASRSRFSEPRQMHAGLQLVSFVSEILNETVFVVLGIILSRIVMNNRYRQIIFGFWNWFVIGLSLYVVLLLCRYFYSRIFINDHSHDSALLFAFGGVHGTVTLAMTFTVANTLSSTTYALVVIVESVVILLSMFVPMIVFKILLPVDGDVVNRKQTRLKVRQEMTAHGIETVKAMHLAPVVESVVLYDLRDQIRKNKLGAFFSAWHATTIDPTTLSTLQSVEQRRALMKAFNAEREYLYELAKQHIVNSTDVYELYSEVLLAESLVMDPQNQVL